MPRGSGFDLMRKTWRPPRRSFYCSPLAQMCTLVGSRRARDVCKERFCQACANTNSLARQEGLRKLVTVDAARHRHSSHAAERRPGIQSNAANMGKIPDESGREGCDSPIDAVATRQRLLVANGGHLGRWLLLVHENCI